MHLSLIMNYMCHSITLVCDVCVDSKALSFLEYPLFVCSVCVYVCVCMCVFVCDFVCACV